jgi:hypothetical protein
MIGFISSVVFLILGVYLMIYGFDGITNLYTQTAGISVLGLGIITMFSAAYEWFTD